MSLNPSQSLAQNVYREIRQLLSNGELAPGSRLVNRSLGKQFGVSLIPVREALSRLASEGLIEHVKLRAKRPESAVPEEEDLHRNIVGEGAILFALLVYFMKVDARSFPGGKILSGSQEPLEVHQIFPRAVLDRYPGRDNEYVPDRLGNLTLLARSDKEHLGEIAPDIYLRIIDQRERTAHLIPEDDSLWTVQSYNAFCEHRERTMTSILRDLLYGLGVT